MSKSHYFVTETFITYVINKGKGVCQMMNLLNNKYKTYFVKGKPQKLMMYLMNSPTESSRTCDENLRQWKMRKRIYRVPVSPVLAIILLLK